MAKIKVLFSLLVLGLAFASCNDNDDTPKFKNLTLNLSGLEDLGSSYVYEGWIIVDKKPVSTGRFSVDASGTPSQTLFSLGYNNLTAATTFVLTIEPKFEDDPAPSAVHILAGDFSGNSGSLSISHAAALGNDFASVEGKYILATPTDEDTTNEKSGIWFLSPGMPPAAGLTLPELPEGWKYEGWAVTGGKAVSTGTFTNVSATDDSAIYSGAKALPAPNGDDGFFPGEDFLMSAPSGLTFPTDLSGGKAVISIEPDPDNSSAPFLLKPLVGDIPADAVDHTAYDMGQNLNFPTGTVSR